MYIHKDIIQINKMMNIIRIKTLFSQKNGSIDIIVDKHIKRIENEENNDLVEVYHLFYDE